MSSVSYVGQSSTPASGTGAITISWPSGHAADDIGILLVQTANQQVATPSGWTLIQHIGTGTGGAVGATGITAFWKRATSAAEADVSVADGGDHQRARILAFRGCDTTISPVGALASAVVAVAQTAVSCPGITTTVDGAMVVAMVANATDATASQTTVGSWDNPDLINTTYVNYGNTTSGVGGGINGFVGEKSTAGAVSPTTSTLATASAQALLTFSLKPPAGAPPPPVVTEGGIFVATGVDTTAGTVLATTATLDAAAVQARLTFALITATPASNHPPVIDAIPALQGAIGALVTFPISVTDQDGDNVVLTLVDGSTSVPTGASIVEDEASGNFIFEWTPDSTQVGSWAFFVRADDGHVTVDSPVAITVVTNADTTLLTLAQSMAARAKSDADAAQTLANLMDQHDQMNANVIRQIRELAADLSASGVYWDGIIAELEATDTGSN